MTSQGASGFYDLIRVEADDYQNKGSRACLLCSGAIAGRPERIESICVPCGDDLIAGRLQGAVTVDDDGTRTVVVNDGMGTRYLPGGPQ